ncbi:MAG TPA: phosphoribosylanthranilate isomerase [Phycisphaerales bacterium]|nr:phosphoribosylanthranilate isomerase [Phycisphaerales bacterium]
MPDHQTGHKWGRTRVKICGVRDVETAVAAAEAGADAIGLVFVDDSPRFIEPDDAFEVMSALPPFVASVGVFKDTDVDAFADIEALCPTQYTQFHGDEDVATVKGCGPDVIKAVKFDPQTIARELLKWASLDEVCAVLVDAPTPGAGLTFDWRELEPHMGLINKPIILAGGLTPDNVADAVRILRPYAVDVSSGVEKERGVKDLGKVRAFCQAAHG